MTLPASGAITSAQIKTEMGLGAADLVVPSDDVRDLTGVAAGAIVWPDDFWSKSWITFDYIESIGDTDQSVVVNVGAASTAGRRLFFVIHWVGSHTAVQTISNVTFAGNACTIHIQRGNRNTATDETIGVAICSVALNTGTSGTVAWSISGGSTVFSRVGSFRATNLTGAAPTDTDSDIANDVTNPEDTVVNVPDNGLWIAACTLDDDADDDLVMTGPTTEAYRINGRSVRYQTFMAANPTATSTVSWSGVDDTGAALVGLSWVMD